MDSKIQESNIFGKKSREQIDNLLQNESDLKCQLDELREDNAAMKLNLNRYRMINEIIILTIYEYIIGYCVYNIMGYCILV